MKFLSVISLLIAGALASNCDPQYPCCNGCDVKYTDNSGKWGVENNNWCKIDNNKCNSSKASSCKFEALGYPCCSHCESIYEDNSGKWGVENNNWCGIPDTCDNKTPDNNTTPIASNDDPDNFFNNKIYCNQDRKDRVQSSINRLSGELKAKAQKIQDAPTAIWLSWDKAPETVSFHLDEAGNQTAVFILYWIPTRDCNSIASQGGAQSMDEYHTYVNRIVNGFKSHPNSKIVVVVEPDTLGNMITSQSNDNCKKVHNLHKQAIAYAIDTFGQIDNVRTYIDAAHGRWLGSHADEAAAIIKEIIDMAPNSNVRGLSTNVSNYQPTEDEYAYHQKLSAELEKLGVHNMKFIVDTARNGVDVAESLVKTGTWCNVKGTGFGERPRGSPDPVNKPLLDAYMWLKPGGDSDGSSTGDHADPVCEHEDSLPGAGDPGDWFHEYFVQLLTNANPPIEV
ncbi:exocellobiohydrolase [Anaeromyces robustus]|uniref:Glucanase n=1 Tax=Anaeromyces robustus TaxID=1754192 RepID=A0A1Y1WSK2_9FUNG|nr:exocellobiohydrolase [Anaeromyces robustus]|eukprot:ORX76513.1 exocellobiohydrolase [Anaeromyces robustus]